MVNIENTTLDANAMRSYLYEVRGQRLKEAIQRGESQYNIDLINHTEFFDVRLRQYVSGFRKTMHALLDETRVFVRCYEEPAVTAIESVIARMRSDFLKNEWYELMPRFEKAVVKINRKITQSRS